MRGLVNILPDEKIITDVYIEGIPVPCWRSQEAYLYIGYAMGIAEAFNALVYKVEWSTDEGTTWFQDADIHDNTDALAAGAVIVSKKEFTYVADSAAETFDYIISSHRIKGNMIKVSFKEVTFKLPIINNGQCKAFIGFKR